MVVETTSPPGANEVTEATGATATVAIAVTVATTDETDIETEDARDLPIFASVATETEMVMRTHLAETIETGSARSDTPVAATVAVAPAAVATENGTEIVAHPAAMLDAMMMSRVGAIATAVMITVGVAETAVMMASRASKNAEARLLLSAASPHLI